LQGTHESLLYVVAPNVSFPGNATNETLPVQHATTLMLTNWPSGNFIAEWYDPATAESLGATQATTSNGGLALPLPDYTDDLAAVLYPPPRLTPLGVSSTNGFQVRLDSETGGVYLVQKSFDLVNWAPYMTVTNATGTVILAIPSGATNPATFFRAMHGL
jgi:hypothetical protein